MNSTVHWRRWGLMPLVGLAIGCGAHTAPTPRADVAPEGRVPAPIVRQADNGYTLQQLRVGIRPAIRDEIGVGLRPSVLMRCVARCRDLWPEGSSQRAGCDARCGLPTFDMARYIEGQINAERTRNGFPSLAADPALENVARIHARDMAQNRRYMANTTDGKTPPEQLKAANVTFNFWGQLYYPISVTSPQNSANPALDALNEWRTNSYFTRYLLNPNLVRMGYGSVQDLQGKYYFTVFLTD